MSNSVIDPGFGIEYTIALIVVIVVCNLLLKANSQMNTVVIVIIGLVVGYITWYLLQYLMPNIQSTATNLYMFSTYQVMSNFNNTGYMHVWPPILAILVIFIILLYNRQLGG